MKRKLPRISIAPSISVTQTQAGEWLSTLCIEGEVTAEVSADGKVVSIGGPRHRSAYIRGWGPRAAEDVHQRATPSVGVTWRPLA